MTNIILEAYFTTEKVKKKKTTFWVSNNTDNFNWAVCATDCGSDGSSGWIRSKVLESFPYALAGSLSVDSVELPVVLLALVEFVPAVFAIFRSESKLSIFNGSTYFYFSKNKKK